MSIWKYACIVRFSDFFKKFFLDVRFLNRVHMLESFWFAQIMISRIKRPSFSQLNSLIKFFFFLILTVTSSRKRLLNVVFDCLFIYKLIFILESSVYLFESWEVVPLAIIVFNFLINWPSFAAKPTLPRFHRTETIRRPILLNPIRIHDISPSICIQLVLIVIDLNDVIALLSNYASHPLVICKEGVRVYQLNLLASLW